MDSAKCCPPLRNAKCCKKMQVKNIINKANKRQRNSRHPPLVHQHSCHPPPQLASLYLPHPVPHHCHHHQTRQGLHHQAHLTGVRVTTSAFKNLSIDDRATGGGGIMRCNGKSKYGKIFLKMRKICEEMRNAIIFCCQTKRHHGGSKPFSKICKGKKTAALVTARNGISPQNYAKLCKTIAKHIFGVRGHAFVFVSC